MYTVGMSIKLPLDKMTIQEKLAVMESLWDDLSRSPKAIDSPEWHKEILDERSKKIADGTAQFVDWEKAKASIREKLR
jgi:putative addiction module component (TIGR02574 family)